VADLPAFLMLTPAQVYAAGGAVVHLRTNAAEPKAKPFRGTLDELKATLGGALMGAG